MKTAIKLALLCALAVTTGYAETVVCPQTIECPTRNCIAPAGWTVMNRSAGVVRGSTLKFTSVAVSEADGIYCSYYPSTGATSANGVQLAKVRPEKGFYGPADKSKWRRGNPEWQCSGAGIAANCSIKSL